MASSVGSGATKNFEYKKSAKIGNIEKHIANRLTINNFKTYLKILLK